ncbi:MAG: hypothetical protein ACFCU3_09940 [Verrucomicrobiales bacterium]
MKIPLHVFERIPGAPLFWSTFGALSITLLLLLQHYAGIPFSTSTTLMVEKVKEREQDHEFQYRLSQPLQPFAAQHSRLIDDQGHELVWTRSRDPVQQHGGGFFTVRENVIHFSTIDNQPPSGVLTLKHAFPVGVPLLVFSLAVSLLAIFATSHNSKATSSFLGIKHYFKEHPSRFIVLWCLGLSILLLRTWPRLMMPDVWNEDGTIHLAQFWDNPWGTLFNNTSGYLILVPRLVSAISTSLSLLHYPLISIGLAHVLIAAVFVFVATSPSYLKGGVFLGLSIFLVPLNTEVFGLPLYLFWWLAICHFVLVFWKGPETHFTLRFVVLLLASLSSPVCLIALPFMWGRAVIFRSSPREIALVFCATFWAGLQALTIYFFSEDGERLQFTLENLVYVVEKFFGLYVGSLYLTDHLLLSGVVLGAILCGAFLLLLIKYRICQNTVVLGALLLLLGLTIAISIRRAPMDLIDPFANAPRYFFFPYILLSWSLLTIFSMREIHGVFRVLAVCALLLTIPNTFSRLWRSHMPRYWSEHLHSATAFETYRFPIQEDGSHVHSWELPLSRERAKQLVLHDTDQPTFPYRVIPGRRLDELPVTLISLEQIELSEWSGAVTPAALFGGFVETHKLQVRSSWNIPSNQQGVVRISMKRGDAVAFARGNPGSQQKIVIENYEEMFLPYPSEERTWQILVFDNLNLPDEFTVIFVDEGSHPDEWSAIAVAP